MLAIIPARGGSKELPKKNVKLLAGKPLIQWTIGAALASKNIEIVIVYFVLCHCYYLKIQKKWTMQVIMRDMF